MFETHRSEVGKPSAQGLERDRTGAREHKQLIGTSNTERNITFTNESRGTTGKDYLNSFLRFITCRDCCGQSHPDENIPLSEVAQGKRPEQPTTQGIELHIESATASQESLPLVDSSDTPKGKIEEIRDKHKWLSKRIGKGVEEPSIQKDLDDMLDVAEQSFATNDNKTSSDLNSIIEKFNSMIDAKKMNTINENYDWLLNNTSHVNPDQIAAYQRNLQSLWKFADRAFRKPDAVALDRVYRNFKHRKQVCMKMKHEKTARSVNRHLSNVSQLMPLKESIKAINEHRGKGSLHSTIIEEGSSAGRSVNSSRMEERSSGFVSRTSSQMGVEGDH